MIKFRPLTKDEIEVKVKQIKDNGLDLRQKDNFGTQLYASN